MTITSSSTTTMAENRVAGWLTPQEFSILEAVCEALLPSLEPPEGSSGTLAAYYRRSAYDLNVAELLAEALAVESAATLTDFRQLLALLASTAASLLLVGRIRPFLELPQEKRERYLRAMGNSPLGELRKGFQVLKRLACFIYFAAPKQQEVNPNWEVMGYPVSTLPPADAPGGCPLPDTPC